MPDKDSNAGNQRLLGKEWRQLKEARKPLAPDPNAPPLAEVLYRESDRGCVLVAHHAIAEAMDVAIKAKLQGLSPISDGDVSYLGKRLMPSFASKADMCYALGIVDASVWRSLALMTALRNAFAHSQGPAVLSEERTGDILVELLGLLTSRTAAVRKASFDICNPKNYTANESFAKNSLIFAVLALVSAIGDRQCIQASP